MPFQTTVNRNYTTGFAGEIVREGPTRAIAARINPVSNPPVDARSYANSFSRAFGYVGEVPVTGQTLAALVHTVELGGEVFAGVLIHPKHHVLQGSAQGGTLAPVYSLPNYTEAEFASMAIIVAEIFNPTKAALAVTPSDTLAYMSQSTAGGDTLLIPLGGLMAFGGAVTGAIEIPNARVLNSVNIAASADGAPVSALTIISLTQ